MRRIWFLALCGYLVFPTTPAAADWLVTSDGQKIETQGPWRIEGKKVLFETTTGSLAMIRLSEIDVDASRAASNPSPETSEGAEESMTGASPEPVVLTVTDEDLTFQPKGLARRLAYRSFEKRMDTLRRPRSGTDNLENAAKLITGLEEALTLMFNTADRFPELDSVPETEEEMEHQIEPLYAYAKALEDQIDYRSHDWQISLLKTVAFRARLIADDASKRPSSGLTRIKMMLR